MEAFTILREIKETKPLLTDEEINFLFGFKSGSAMYTMVDLKHEENIDTKLSSLFLKRKEDYYYAKEYDKLDDFKEELNDELAKILGKNKHKKMEEYLDKVKELSSKISDNVKDTIENPDKIIFNLFLSEYNTKYSFTWGAFKKTKRNFERVHPLKGENIYNLKTVLEDDPKIMGKITDDTLFCKGSHTLSKETLEKLEEK